MADGGCRSALNIFQQLPVFERMGSLLILRRRCLRIPGDQQDVFFYAPVDKGGLKKMAYFKAEFSNRLLPGRNWWKNKKCLLRLGLLSVKYYRSRIKKNH